MAACLCHAGSGKCMKRWLSFFIGGQKWTVYLVSPKSKHLQDDETWLAGLCSCEKCRIYISNALDEQAREDTLLHEILHALLYITGAGKAFKIGDDVEENFVLSMTPVMHRLLKDLGFRFPLLAKS